MFVRASARRILPRPVLRASRISAPRASSSAPVLFSSLPGSPDVDPTTGVPIPPRITDDFRRSLSRSILYPTVRVPASEAHRAVSHPAVRTVLARFDGWNVHPRPRVVRSAGEREEDRGYRALLLEPADGDAGAVGAALHPHLPAAVEEYLLSIHATAFPPAEVRIGYAQLPLSEILCALVPPHAHPPPSGFEIVGHVAHLNLKPAHVPYGRLVAEAIVDRLPSVRTVVNKVGQVGGPYRTYQMDILAGEAGDTAVELVEGGVKLRFDLSKVYWSARLQGERNRLVTQEFGRGQTIADAFCGVGAVAVRAASDLGCTVLSNDLNPAACGYAEENARRNGVPPDRFSVSCGDAREFIRGLGHREGGPPDHLLMNLPASSTEFLDELRWWPKEPAGATTCSVHVYTFARADGSTTAERAAYDAVADVLLPEFVRAVGRREHLDALGCAIRAHEVRDVAPGKVVFCVTFQATRALISHMRGDFVDV